MNSFNEWLAALGPVRRGVYKNESDVLARFQWMWQDYCQETFAAAKPKVNLPESHLEAKVKEIWNKAGANGTKTAADLDLFSKTLLESYKKDNIPMEDNDTLCIYHSFSNVSAVPQGQRSALVLCTEWKTDRVVADLAYDDDRCVKMMAVKYGFTKWSPMKGTEILGNYKKPGTELIISVYQNSSTIPVKYWTDGTWHNKEFDISNNAVLDEMLKNPGTYGHAIYAKVERNDLIKFYDNKNMNGKSTTQIQEAAKPLRCLIFSKPS